MLRKVLHSKIHMARVTAASAHYMGSITIDAELLERSGMRVNDAVLVANCRNGARFETYIFRGEPGSRQIIVNGAAAHLVEIGDELIILHFAYVDDEEYRRHRPTVLLMREDNTVEHVLHYEPGFS
jgi:aspartate 1-decarboxylase